MLSERRVWGTCITINYTDRLFMVPHLLRAWDAYIVTKATDEHITHTHTLTHTQSQCQTYLSQISYLCSPVTKIVYFPPKWCPFQILFAQMGNGYYRLWPNAHTHLETLKTENRAKVFKKIISIRRIEPQCNSSTMQEPIYFSLHNWS